jgi:hypothetical protein
MTGQNSLLSLLALHILTKLKIPHRLLGAPGSH